MKRLRWIGLLCAVLLGACDGKEGYDSKLDGMWQMVDTSIYYSFQVNVVNVKQTGGNSYFGHYNYENDSIYITIRNATKEAVEPLGLKDTIQNFEVETLTHKRLILRSDDTRMVFRKY